MKKLFFIIGFLTLSIFSFGAGVTSEGYAESSLPVKITVVEDLGLETFGVDFGIIFQGQTKTKPDIEGKVRVIGKGLGTKKYFTMEVKDSKNNYIAYKDKNQTFNVQLTKKGVEVPKSNEKMNAVLKLIPTVGILMPGDGNFFEGLAGFLIQVILRKNGITVNGDKGEFTVTGSLIAGADQAEGDYEGHLYVRIKSVF